MDPRTETRPECPLCGGRRYRSEILLVYGEGAAEKRPLTAMTCTRCAHVLFFAGGSNLFDLT